MANITSIIFVLYLVHQTLCQNLKAVHYDGVTLKSCGLKRSEHKPGIAHHSCFKWHKTIWEQNMAINKIMNGRFAEEGEFPYTVLIYMSRYLSTSHCTGAVLNEEWIITAAHCFQGWSADDIKIYPGITHYDEWSSVSYKVAKIFPYGTFDVNKYPENLYDLALMKLKTKLDFNRDNNRVNSVCLPNRDYAQTKLAILTGWGYLNEGQENKRTLKMTPITLDAAVHNHPVMVSLYSIRYGNPCSGDSGGPIVQYVNNRAVLIGTHIGSWPKEERETCGRNITKTTISFIPFYIDWIKNTILNN